MAQTPLLAYTRVMVFIELPIFVRCAEDLFTDEDITKLQLILLKNPSVGALIPGGRGLRKLRVPPSRAWEARRGTGDLLPLGEPRSLLSHLRVCQKCRK